MGRRSVPRRYTERTYCIENLFARLNDRPRRTMLD
jgi:hypothetical protein